jgi:hypothetical protein
MADTTVTFDDSKKERLSKYRTDAHDSWGDVLDGLMDIVPTPEKVAEDGCINCGQTPRFPDQIWSSEGAIHFFKTDFEGNELRYANYFCSPGCAQEAQEDAEAHLPREPDTVIVGGLEDQRVKLNGATFLLDGQAMEVGLNIPGAFSDEDHTGTPVYIENGEKIVQEGVIDHVAHEENHTTLVLGRDHGVTRRNHPDEETREEYIEMRSKWTDGECAVCREEFRYQVEEPPEECPHCGAEKW